MHLAKPILERITFVQDAKQVGYCPTRTSTGCVDTKDQFIWFRVQRFSVFIN